MWTTSSREPKVPALKIEPDGCEKPKWGPSEMATLLMARFKARRTRTSQRGVVLVSVGEGVGLDGNAGRVGAAFGPLFNGVLLAVGQGEGHAQHTVGLVGLGPDVVAFAGVDAPLEILGPDKVLGDRPGDVVDLSTCLLASSAYRAAWSAVVRTSRSLYWGLWYQGSRPSSRPTVPIRRGFRRPTGSA